MEQVDHLMVIDYMNYPVIFISEWSKKPNPEVEILYDKNLRSSLASWCECEDIKALSDDLDLKALGLNGIPHCSDQQLFSNGQKWINSKKFEDKFKHERKMLECPKHWKLPIKKNSLYFRNVRRHLRPRTVLPKNS